MRMPRSTAAKKTAPAPPRKRTKKTPSLLPDGTGGAAAASAVARKNKALEVLAAKPTAASELARVDFGDLARADAPPGKKRVIKRRSGMKYRPKIVRESKTVSAEVMIIKMSDIAGMGATEVEVLTILGRMYIILSMVVQEWGDAPASKKYLQSLKVMRATMRCTGTMLRLAKNPGRTSTITRIAAAANCMVANIGDLDSPWKCIKARGTTSAKHQADMLARQLTFLTLYERLDNIFCKAHRALHPQTSFTLIKVDAPNAESDATAVVAPPDQKQETPV